MIGKGFHGYNSSSHRLWNMKAVIYLICAFYRFDMSIRDLP